jgi:hypothetical protein
MDRLAIKKYLRRDVLILRQVVYKVLMEHKLNNNQEPTLTEKDKQWIDQQVEFFLSDMPDRLVDRYINEFFPNAHEAKSDKQIEQELEALIEEGQEE